jgi:hypothetical protein
MRSDAVSADEAELLAGVDCVDLIEQGDLRRMPLAAEFEPDRPEPLTPVVSHKPSGKAKKVHLEPQPEAVPVPDGQK